jgi:hypothetical protein
MLRDAVKLDEIIIVLIKIRAFKFLRIKIPRKTNSTPKSIEIKPLFLPGAPKIDR